MSENTSITELSSQYTAQVTSDLERNTKEQERIADEIAALNEQLAALQRNHAVLVSIQQAIDAVPAPTDTTEKSEDAVTVPAPRKQTSSNARTSKGAKATKSAGEAKAAKPAVGKRSGAAKSPVKSSVKSRAAAGGKAASAKPAGKAAPAAKTAQQPTLVDLVRRHLGEQSEPRSAAEVTTALTQAHPERSVKTTVIRTTLEGLVARNQAHRSKQGTSVFYTATDTPEASGSSQKDAAQTVPADV
ncbi:hypothetical protein ACIRG4_18690 [Streptomyces sp. NPDC102395]|uniref:hypothetical protein n=1 Tax=Streptomyces sp. NPDC102395 TaxID=3366168 RepID=UPI00381645C1